MVDFFIFIKEQQKVELIFEGDRRIYGTIISVIGDIVTIVSEQKINVKIGQPVEVNTYSENGVYSGLSHIISYASDSNKRSIVINYPKEIKHSQRREYLRATINASFQLTIINDNQEEIINGKTRDICGKGISFFYEKPLSQFSKYNVKIKLKGKEIISSCQLVYTRFTIEKGKPQFVNAFVLTGITVDDIKFLVDECIYYHLKHG